MMISSKEEPLVVTKGTKKITQITHENTWKREKSGERDRKRKMNASHRTQAIPTSWR
jgi:hypothetical protein